MKILYVMGHPDSDSLHGALCEAFGNAVNPSHELTILRLGAERFDPVLRYGYRKEMEDEEFIVRSRRLVLESDLIVFAFPIWWGTAPSILRGWVDRVFLPGLTFSIRETGDYEKKLLGKKAAIIASGDVPESLWAETGNTAVENFTRNLFVLTGLECVREVRIGQTSDPAFDGKEAIRAIEEYAKAI